MPVIVLAAAIFYRQVAILQRILRLVGLERRFVAFFPDPVRLLRPDRRRPSFSPQPVPLLADFNSIL
jgi:hypothetical protein